MQSFARASRRSFREQVKELEDYELDTLEIVRKTRPYKIPKGYLDWRWVSGAIASCIKIDMENLDADKVTLAWAALVSMWYKKQAPVYCLENDLLKELLETEILDRADILKDFIPALSSFIVILPDNSFKTSDGVNVSFIVGDCLYEELNSFDTPYNRQIGWAAMDDSGCCWYSAKGVDESGKLYENKCFSDSNQVTSREREFIRRGEKLIWNIFLLLTYEPETILEYRIREKGFSRQKTDTSGRCWYPRWLTQTPKPKVTYIYEQPRGDIPESDRRASPRSHLRKAHWRRVRCGERGRDRKWARIPQSVVMGDK